MRPRTSRERELRKRRRNTGKKKEEKIRRI
jgi:hypothetical protein